MKRRAVKVKVVETKLLHVEPGDVVVFRVDHLPDTAEEAKELGEALEAAWKDGSGLDNPVLITDAAGVEVLRPTDPSLPIINIHVGGEEDPVLIAQCVQAGITERLGVDTRSSRD